MDKTKKLALTAMFAAFCCVATMVIRIPTIGTSGYVNIGDTLVLISAWMLGGVYGTIAAGIGSMLADILAGYPMYAPGTLIIKMVMAIVAVIIFNALKKVKINTFIAYSISAIVAEIIMVAGYFLYESTLLGYGMGAAGSIPGNIAQGVTCLILSVGVVTVLDKTKMMDRIK